MKLAIISICFLQLAAVNCILAARDKSNLVTKKNTDHNMSSNELSEKKLVQLSQSKTRTLFARRVTQEQQLRVTKPKIKPVPPTLHCSKVMESCMLHSRCCEPCAFCHCRFFSAICYCLKLGRYCQMKL